MYALIGGSHIPEAQRSPPTTHLDALFDHFHCHGKSQWRNGASCHRAALPCSAEFWS